MGLHQIRPSPAPHGPARSITGRVLRGAANPRRVTPPEPAAARLGYRTRTGSVMGIPTTIRRRFGGD